MNSGIIVSVIVIAGLASVGLIVGYLLNSNTNNTDSKVVDVIDFTQCLDFETVQKVTKYHMKKPPYFLAGYDLQCAQASPIDARLFYNKTKIDGNLSESKIIQQGGILISSSLSDETTDPAYHQRNITNSMIKSHEQIGPEFSRISSINGNIALVREMCDSCGNFTANYSDGSTVSIGVPAPSWIFFYDEDVLYSIEGYIPSIDLEQIAKSMN